MALGTTNISTSLVGSTINLLSYDVGQLCAKAKIGGTGGFAFKIIENGFLNTNGELIADALPYYNIWSTKAPAQWRLPANPANNIFYALNRDVSFSKYSFQLHSFRGYEHAAQAPQIGDGFSEMLTQVTYPSDVLIYASAFLGSYDWESIGAYGVRFNIYKAGTKIKSSATFPIEVDASVIDNDIIVSEDLRFEKDITYDVRLCLMSDAGTELGLLPMKGEFLLSIVESSGPPSHENELNINISLPVTGTWSALLGYGLDIYRTFTPDDDFSIYDDPITLESIDYIIKSNVDESVISVTSVTSFDDDDKPTIIYKQKEGNAYLFKAKQRVTPAYGQYLEINMNYNI